jgi:RNA polymerase sigma factor (sigma-70 family)
MNDRDREKFLRIAEPTILLLARRFANQFASFGLAVDDLCQEARIRVWQKAPEYRPLRTSCADAFVYAFATRAILDFIRETYGRNGQKAHLFVSLSDANGRDAEKVVYDGASPERQVMIAEGFRLAFQTVGSFQQDVLIRTFGFFGESAQTRDEIASALGVTSPCISIHKQHGLKVLQKRLKLILNDEI